MPKAGVVAFAVPVSFLTLLGPQLTQRPRTLAVVVAAVVAIACAGLPANAGMTPGIAAGVATGWWEVGS
ncbi:hypothetical protein QYF68_04925 [Mycolicibacterium austroafricanum]|uniref:Uncharacterized protein n=1 Tax=Mycolicibacterium austroafricanum TaxID=39687 RepID=A0ABT8H8T3_MYCAO|nr:hypothetical protein [Mycolicibacterium austroafricanum]MDN4517168.1 hypothetical protein [Mycolicibacterium austroafricanum]